MSQGQVHETDWSGVDPACAARFIAVRASLPVLAAGLCRHIKGLIVVIYAESLPQTGGSYRSVLSCPVLPRGWIGRQVYSFARGPAPRAERLGKPSTCRRLVLRQGDCHAITFAVQGSLIVE